MYRKHNISLDGDDFYALISARDQADGYIVYARRLRTAVDQLAHVIRETLGEQAFPADLDTRPLDIPCALCGAYHSSEDFHRYCNACRAAAHNGGYPSEK